MYRSVFDRIRNLEFCALAVVAAVVDYGTVDVVAVDSTAAVVVAVVAAF